jgi:thiol-disulfide isomerase/thioredoxin
MIEVDTKENLDAQLKNNKTVMALFYATWCPYCIRFVPVFDGKMEELGVNEVVHVILDDDDNPLWVEYDVPAVPTVIYFENGKASKRLNGRLGSGIKEAQFEDWLNQLKL